MTHVGIDFGAKKAGTTVICALQESSWFIRQSSSGIDADTFLEKEIVRLNPDYIFIDAPLSLPRVYSQEFMDPEADFHYRECDRLAGAMSPLFLGGLTARAIRLRSIWESSGIHVLETYPKLMAAELKAVTYKKDLDLFRKTLNQFLDKALPGLQSWHQADACLAWLSGFRYLEGNALVIGDKKEGQIIY